MYSKARTAPSSAARKRRNSASAASSDGQAQSAVATLARCREKAQHGLGDDAQRSLAAHEQVAQRIAGVVLAQPPQPLEDAAVGSTTSSPSISSRALP
jgi:hypothetical protein